MKFDTIGKNIREYRLAKKLRQEDLAEMVEVSTNYIGMVERGEKVPSLETLIKIINALNVSADMILADVIDKGYEIKSSLISEKLGSLSKTDRDRIYAVIDTMIQHSK